MGVYYPNRHRGFTQVSHGNINYDISAILVDLVQKNNLSLSYTLLNSDKSTPSFETFTQINSMNNDITVAGKTHKLFPTNSNINQFVWDKVY